MSRNSLFQFLARNSLRAGLTPLVALSLPSIAATQEPADKVLALPSTAITDTADQQADRPAGRRCR